MCLCLGQDFFDFGYCCVMVGVLCGGYGFQCEDVVGVVVEVKGEIVYWVSVGDVGGLVLVLVWLDFQWVNCDFVLIFNVGSIQVCGGEGMGFCVGQCLQVQFVVLCINIIFLCCCC